MVSHSHITAKNHTEVTDTHRWDNSSAIVLLQRNDIDYDSYCREPSQINCLFWIYFKLITIYIFVDGLNTDE